MLGSPNDNAAVWRGLYRAGRNDLLYPNDAFVRVFSKFNAPQMRVLDHGFGTGANLIHMAKCGHAVSGVEISVDALDKTAKRLKEADLTADLRLIEAGQKLQFPNDSFDIVVSWQVVYYNDPAGLAAIATELGRVCRPGGTIIVAMAAPSDISYAMSDAGPNGARISRVPGQEGCILTILDRHEIPLFFKGSDLKIGEFHLSYDRVTSWHWVLTYRPVKGQE